MGAHRYARPLRIMVCDSLQNPAMMLLPTFRAGLYVKSLQTLFAQQPDNRIEQRKNQWICCRFRQSQMKIEVAFNESLRIVLARTVHHIDSFSHHGEMLLLDARGGKCGDFRLQNLSYFSEMSCPVRLPDFNHQIERLANSLRSSVSYECPSPRMSFHQAFFPKRLHRLANGSAAHAKLLRQIAFGWQLIARLP